MCDTDTRHIKPYYKGHAVLLFSTDSVYTTQERLIKLYTNTFYNRKNFDSQIKYM
jgi:hypothetical protein